MKKNNTKGFLILGILFAVISIIAFAVPTQKTATFWIAYAFTTVAFAAQILIWKTALGKDDTLKSKFLGYPILHIGIVYLIVQIVAFAVFLFVPTASAWVVVVVCVLIAGISAICMISADTGKNEIQRVEAKVQKKVFYIRSLQVDVELLADKETDAETKAALTQLVEKIRFSDPMSYSELEVVEKELANKIYALKTSADKLTAIAEIDALLVERNAKIKILK